MRHDRLILRSRRSSFGVDCGRYQRCILRITEVGEKGWFITLIKVFHRCSFFGLGVFRPTVCEIGSKEESWAERIYSTLSPSAPTVTIPSLLLFFSSFSSSFLLDQSISLITEF